MSIYRTKSWSKTAIYVAGSLLAGALLSMMCVPPRAGCGLDSYVHMGTKRKASEGQAEPMEYGTDAAGRPLSDDDFNPVLVSSKRPAVRKDSDRTLVRRPRYIATELQIKEKLFVGVTVSRAEVDRDSTTVAINRTLAQAANRLVFFTAASPDSLPSGMSVVAFPGEQVNVRNFQIWKYIYEHHGNDYDWFLLIQDDTYIFGEQFLEFLGHMSIGRDLYMGIPIHEAETDVTFCSREAGYMVSRSLLAKVGPYWEDCMHKSWNDVPDLEFGRCVQSHTGVRCSSTYEGSPFYAYNFEDKVLTDKEKTDSDFQKALTFYHVMDTRTLYTLHKYFTERWLSRTLEQIAALQRDIEETSTYAPGGKATLTWPVGLRGPYQPASRFDVLDWEYFSMTHLFALGGGRSDEPKSPLIGADKQDVDEILTATMAQLNQRHGDAYMLGRLLNGYRRFDPTRGMEYTLDLELRLRGGGGGGDDKREVLRRVHLLRPLNQVEIVFMPYVTEYTQVTLVVPVLAGSQDQVRVFLDSYARVCLESRDKSAVMLVFVYSPSEARAMAASDDIYGANKGYVSYLERRYPGAHLSWVSVRTSLPSPIALMDVVSKKFAADTLFLLTGPGLELAAEFLNRVRMNTIAGWQVFFPVPFAQYDPATVTADSPGPSRLEVAKSAGHFDAYLFEHASFYNSDYVAARKSWDERHPGGGTEHIQSDLDLFEMFLATKLNVFRAVDPSLKLHYQPRSCPPSLKEEQYQRCLEGRAEGLASRSQLAMLVFEQQKAAAAAAGDGEQDQKQE